METKTFTNSEGKTFKRIESVQEYEINGELYLKQLEEEKAKKEQELADLHAEINSLKLISVKAE